MEDTNGAAAEISAENNVEKKNINFAEIDSLRRNSFRVKVKDLAIKKR